MAERQVERFARPDRDGDRHERSTAADRLFCGRRARSPSRCRWRCTPLPSACDHALERRNGVDGDVLRRRTRGPRGRLWRAELSSRGDRRQRRRRAIWASVWNSSSTNSWRRRDVSGSRTRIASRSSVSGRSSRIVTNSFERRAMSACSSSASRGRFFVISARAARIALEVAELRERARGAVLSPMPFTPGTLSDVSPTRAR